MSGIIPWLGLDIANETTTSQQYQPRVSALPDGGYVVVWTSRTDPTTTDWFSNRDIYAQRFNSAGSPVGAELVIDGGDGTWDDYPTVTGLSGGGWFVAWNNYVNTTTGALTSGQFYNANGKKVGPEIALGDGSTPPNVAELSDGRVAIVFRGDVPGAYNTAVKAAVYNPDGTVDIGTTVISDERTVSPTYDYAEWPAVAALKDGRFVVAYQYNPNGVPGTFDDTDMGVYFRIVEADGTMEIGQTLVNTTTAGTDDNAQVAMLGDGSFVITWTGASDGSSRGVRGQVFDDDGKPRGDEFDVNTTTANTQSTSRVVGLKDGTFLVVWQSNYQGLVAQQFDADGKKIGVETVLDDGSDHGWLYNPDIAVLSDGRIALVADQGSSTSGDILGGIFDPRGATITGSAVTETIFGNDLNNVIKGLNGQDRILAGDGDDTVYGGNGADKILGGKGQDLLIGNNQNDLLRGGGNNDTLKGHKGDDTLLGEKGNDVLIGGGDDDILKGGAGRDNLAGGRRNDTLFGGNRNDILDGEGGQDRLDGGSGNDTLTGGTGIDTFVFGEGRDKITDFKDDIDTIELDAALWVGTLTVQEVLDTFGTNADADVVLDFGGGNILTIRNVADINTLADDIVIV